MHPAVFSCLADRVYGIAPMVDAALCLGGCIQWCKELLDSGFKEILSINPDNLPEAQAMQHGTAMENVRRTGRILAEYIQTRDGIKNSIPGSR